jgi:hypothetical protein
MQGGGDRPSSAVHRSAVSSSVPGSDPGGADLPVRRTAIPLNIISRAYRPQDSVIGSSTTILSTARGVRVLRRGLRLAINNVRFVDRDIGPCRRRINCGAGRPIWTQLQHCARVRSRSVWGARERPQGRQRGSAESVVNPVERDLNSGASFNGQRFIGHGCANLAASRNPGISCGCHPPTPPACYAGRSSCAGRNKGASGRSDSVHVLTVRVRR